MNFKKCFTAVALVSVVANSFALAGEDDGVIFDAGVNSGVFRHADGLGNKQVNPMVEINGALVIGDLDASNVSVDMGMITTVRDGGAKVTTADVALKGRYLPRENRVGFEASIPFKYRRDDNYYEFSALEVSAIVKVAEGNGHQLLAKVGLNPFTKRTYGNNFGTTVTQYDPAVASDGFIDTPDYAQVYGAPQYVHDGRADHTFNDNRGVYFGGGTLTRDVVTNFDTSEYSLRVPVAIEYKYRSSNKKLVIHAVAYYTMRAGVDTLTQNDSFRDQYDGYVSYSNVNWNVCYDTRGSYLCNPHNLQYDGMGQIVDRYDNSTTLESKGFLAHNFGGKVDARYSIYKNHVTEVMLNIQGRAEVDTHVMDAVGSAHTAARVMATGGAIVRW